MKRAFFDEDDDNWKLQPLSESNAGGAIGGSSGAGGVVKRPVSAAGHRRPISEYAKIAARGGNPRYKGENILQVGTHALEGTWTYLIDLLIGFEARVYAATLNLSLLVTFVA